MAVIKFLFETVRIILKITALHFTILLVTRKCTHETVTWGTVMGKIENDWSSHKFVWEQISWCRVTSHAFHWALSTHSRDLKIPRDCKEFMWDPLFFQRVTPVESSSRKSFPAIIFLNIFWFCFKSGTFGNKRRAFSNSIVKKTQLKTWLRDG